MIEYRIIAKATFAFPCGVMSSNLTAKRERLLFMTTYVVDQVIREPSSPGQIVSTFHWSYFGIVYHLYRSEDNDGRY